MAFINQYRRHSISINKYSKYHQMRPIASYINYEQYRFISVYEPKYTKKNIVHSENAIHVFDLRSLLKNASFIKENFSFDNLTQVQKFTAPKPVLSNLLPEPALPEKPNDYDNLLLVSKIPDQPIYQKPIINSKILSVFPKIISILIEKMVIFFHGNVYNKKKMAWEISLKETEAKVTSLIKKRPEFLTYEEDLKNYYEALAVWEEKFPDADSDLSKALSVWSSKEEEFNHQMKAEISSLILLRTGYSQKNKTAIEEFFKLVLLQSPYPNFFRKHFEINYDVETAIIVVDFELPNFDNFSIVENGAKNNLKDMPKGRRASVIESSLYAIAIRTLYEIASTDKNNDIASIVFNGRITFIDKSNGSERNECILSVHALKDEINKLIIEHIDSVECFKSLKGISAKNILEYIPVAPILFFDKNDGRLIEGRDVIETLSNDVNLAAIDWNDFEHLIRELFEKEFSESGTEVRITHASHDRGVDAIIYDPDPIKGGKFIIQAKRYTRLVDVSAVRDLYGTIQNEGANRGILVTTSHYGPDAYEFAKNKNITLLTGENLLHLLEKHGYKFKIDLKEARKILNLKP